MHVTKTQFHTITVRLELGLDRVRVVEQGRLRAGLNGTHGHRELVWVAQGQGLLVSLVHPIWRGQLLLGHGRELWERQVQGEQQGAEVTLGCPVPTLPLRP